MDPISNTGCYVWKLMYFLWITAPSGHHAKFRLQSVCWNETTNDKSNLIISSLLNQYKEIQLSQANFTTIMVHAHAPRHIYVSAKVCAFKYQNDLISVFIPHWKMRSHSRYKSFLSYKGTISISGDTMGCTVLCCVVLCCVMLAT